MRWGEVVIKRLIAVVFATLIFLSDCSAASALNRVMGIDMLGIESDVTVGLPNASAVFEFPVPRLAQIQSASATITMTTNPQVNGDTLVFFYYNDKFAGTRTVKEIRQQPAFVLNLPVDGVFRDTARLQIKSSNMFMTDDVCRDYFSGGLFFSVHKNTSLNLTYEMLPVRTVANFFGSFQQSLLVVVPDKATLAEIAPGAWAYGLLRKMYPYLDIHFVRAAELAKMPPVPRIWIGVGPKLPEYFKSAAHGITLIDSNTLLISAADAENLRAYVRQLKDLPVFLLNPAASQRISVTPLETSSGKAIEAIAFGNKNFQEGILMVPADFSLFPALLDKIPERLGLHLEGAHTVAYESVRPARMDVFLNGSIVYSSVLDQSGQFKKDILLPETVELRSRNNLNIQFNYPEEPGQCRVRGKIESAQIFPSSYIWGAGQYQVTQFGWDNIGLFFGRRGTVLLDETLGVNLLKTMGELAYFLDRQLPPGIFAFPEFLPLTQQTEPTGEGYVLVAGITGNIPDKFQERMPISLGQDFTVYRKASEKILFEYQPNVNSVVGRVGEIKGVPLILLTANLDGGLLGESLRYLGQPQNQDALTGNVFIYQQPNQLYSFDVRDRSVKIEKPAVKGMVSELWEQNRNLILIAAGILVIFILFFLIFRRMFPRRRFNREAERSGAPGDPLIK